MRLATLKGNAPRRLKWLARLSKSKKDDFIRLKKRSEKDAATREFRDSLNALIPFTGFWPAMQLGIFYRLLTIYYPEVVSISFAYFIYVLIIILENDAIPPSSPSSVKLHS